MKETPPQINIGINPKGGYKIDSIPKQVRRKKLLVLKN